MNQKIKAYYHHNTKSGGNGDSRLVPIAKFLQREMMWRSGRADKFFMKREHDAIVDSRIKKNFWLSQLHGIVGLGTTSEEEEIE